jgi:hypothetical protein
VPPDVARELMIRRGVPADFADLTLRFQARLLDLPPELTSTVRQVTGRPARTFDQWAAERAADFLDGPPDSPSGP